jgi:hypothetical protein
MVTADALLSALHYHQDMSSSTHHQASPSTFRALAMILLTSPCSTAERSDVIGPAPLLCCRSLQR